MLDKNVRKQYYVYFNYYEKLQTTLVKTLHSENIYLNKKENQNLTNTFQNYINSLKSLKKLLTEKKYSKPEYKKYHNEIKKQIETSQKQIETEFENLLENQLEKFVNCKQLSKQLQQFENQIKTFLSYYSSYTNYKFNVNLNKIKKIKKENLEFADIILSVKSQKQINSRFFSKIIQKVSNSKIGHSTIFLENKNKKNYYIDTDDDQITIKNLLNPTFELKYQKIEKKYSKNIKGLVLRIKNQLSENEKNQIQQYITNHIYQKKYGIPKAFLALGISKLYVTFPKLKFLILKNPQSSLKTAFCSEMITKTYQSANIILNNKLDPAMVSPNDLLNSPQLEIIGYIED